MLPSGLYRYTLWRGELPMEATSLLAYSHCRVPAGNASALPQAGPCLMSSPVTTFPA